MLKYIICILLTATSISATPIDRIIAVVNRDMVTESELTSAENLWKFQSNKNKMQLPSRDILREKLLENLILEKIQLQIADRHGINVDNVTLDNIINEISKSDGTSLDEFQESLSKEGISFEQYRDYVKRSLITEELRRQAIGYKISVSENEIQDYLNSPIGQEAAGYEYNISHILIGLPEAPSSKILQQKTIKANEIAKKAKDGEDFAKLAITESDGRNAINGGNLGWKKASDLPTIFAKHINALVKDKVVGPIRSNSGFHILKLIDKRSKIDEDNLETKVQHILIKTGSNMSDNEAKTLLKNLRQEILEKKNFEEMAKRYSTEKFSSENGGHLNWISKNSVSPTFYRKMNLLAPGEISNPFKSEIGWHLVKVLDRRDAKTSQEALRNQVHKILYNRKFNDYVLTWFNEITSEANVEKFLG